MNPQPRERTFANDLAEALGQLVTPTVQVLSPKPLPHGYWPARYIPTGEKIVAFPVAVGTLLAERYPGILVGRMPDGVKIYAADDGGGQTALEIITNVCAIKETVDGYDVVTGLTIERTDVSLRGALGPDPTCVDDPEDCCPCGPCGECDIIPGFEHVTISGVISMPMGSDASCAAPICPQLDGRFTITCPSLGDPCTWAYDFTIRACPDNGDLPMRWYLFFDGSTWFLQLIRTDVSHIWAIYTGPADGDFNCMGSNTFNLTSSDFDDSGIPMTVYCQNWPITLMLTPGP